ncbi:hypothetical protein BS333_17175 [Vibrio azureus]|uniref:Uncharacterized protein n=1 Tax=Vibrio azureus NBRC 104587 TaxID=1219077 RepID=U3ANZ2_9VIBR|nr:hypothetical protein [Vibrio azureus]AUI88099.1 hypothetical protein BS333_17175 [Vibrio azureus]GAD75017.1 hypothetical protein VAZ01S_017_01120 [Vibrio azureus NBRC 104587]
MEYSLSIVNGKREINETNDNIDVEIHLKDGSVYSATLFSMENITEIMESYQNTGECLNGAFFWASDMIIIQNFKLETINNIIKELVESGEYKYACSKIN